MAEERKPLFVRLPASQVLQIDAAARSAGKSKQDFVANVLAASLGSSREPSTSPLVISEGTGSGTDDVLTLGELSKLLKTNEGAVLARVVDGDLPGRRFGNDWRFSRAAVLDWLGGRDGERRTYGFHGEAQQIDRRRPSERKRP